MWKRLWIWMQLVRSNRRPLEWSDLDDRIYQYVASACFDNCHGKYLGFGIFICIADFELYFTGILPLFSARGNNKNYYQINSYNHEVGFPVIMAIWNNFVSFLALFHFGCHVAFIINLWNDFSKFKRYFDTRFFGELCTGLRFKHIITFVWYDKSWY
jgi:hypothetical protein